MCTKPEIVSLRGRKIRSQLYWLNADCSEVLSGRPFCPNMRTDKCLMLQYAAPSWNSAFKNLSQLWPFHKKKEMKNTSRLNKMSWWKVKSCFSFFLAPSLTFTSGVRMAAISFYVVIVKTEQTIKGKATHAEKAPTLQRHLGEFIAEHLTFFKSEIVVTLREIFDESVEAGKRHAYQINEVDGGCRRSRV